MIQFSYRCYPGGSLLAPSMTALFYSTITSVYNGFCLRPTVLAVCAGSNSLSSFLFNRPQRKTTWCFKRAFESKSINESNSKKKKKKKNNNNKKTTYDQLLIIANLFIVAMCLSACSHEITKGWLYKPLSMLR